jgi:hypothetical protein
MLPRDVHPEMLKKHDELLRRQTEVQRARGVQRLWEAGRHMARLNVRARYPDASEQLIRWLTTELIYDTRTAEQILGPRPIS